MARFLRVILFVFILVACKQSANKVQNQELDLPKNVIFLPDSALEEYFPIRSSNLGVVYEGETIEGEVNLAHIRDSVVTITSIKGSCGCMEIGNTPKLIEKGEVKRVKFQINTNGKSGEEYFDIILDTSIGKFLVEMVATVK